MANKALEAEINKKSSSP